MDQGLATTRLTAVPVPSTLSVEIVGPAALRGEVHAWRSLAARAAEPHPFDDPEILLAALQHLPGGRDVPLMAVRRGGALQAVIPVVTPRGLLSAGEARHWQPAPLPALPPLVAAERTLEVMEAVLDAARARRFARLVFPGLDPEGPVAAALAAAAARTGRAIASVERPGQPDPEAQAGADLPGEVRVERGRTPRQVRDAIEILLTLDAKASSRRSPALIADPGAACFLRTASRRLAALRRCRADVLWAGDRPLAAALSATGGGAAWLWRAAAEPSPEGAAALARLSREVVRGAARQGLDMADHRAGGPARAAVDIAVEARPAEEAARFRVLVSRGVGALAPGWMRA